jgi:hypothetical protein
VIVHSIPTGVLGVARYLEGARPMSSWVGQLGTRRVPRDIERLVAGRAGVFWVEVESLREPAPEEAWLKRNARLVEATSNDFGGRVLHFVPQAGERVR